MRRETKRIHICVCTVEVQGYFTINLRLQFAGEQREFTFRKFRLFLTVNDSLDLQTVDIDFYRFNCEAQREREKLLL